MRDRLEEAGGEVLTQLASGSTASPTPGFPAGQAPGSNVAVLGRCSRDGAAGTYSAQAVASGMDLEAVATAGPATAGGSAVTAA
ncbi:uncharacterized protein C1orf167-like [Tupaia chinensis]|uniref:uncharacterized protein C1orf167-like n=1 Tax=Tupaia chinensis TaxID=246437 RepID=UPI0003C8D5F6|nr:uncharacterized protein C1orf167-like [Tupaia chinensis]